MKQTRLLLRTTACALALGLTFAGSVPTFAQTNSNDQVQTTETGPQLDFDVETFTLSNGLTVLVNPDPRTQQVGVFVSYHVGLRDEEPGQLEYSHLFEHLMFTGSRNNPGEYFEMLESNGISTINAYTAPDFTSYLQMAPRNALDLVLFAESDRMAYFREEITQDKIDRESEIVLNEHLERSAEPLFRMIYALNEGLYQPGHPYYSRSEQLFRDMRAATLEDVLGWYDRFYGPNNAVLGLTGNITVDEARELAELYFGHIDPVAPVVRAYEYAEPTVGVNADQYGYEGANDLFGLTAMLPPTRDPEITNIELASLFLNADEEHSLSFVLSDQEDLVTDVFQFINPGEVSSNMIFIATVQDGVDVETVSTRVQQLIRTLPDVLDEEAFEKTRARYIDGLVTELSTLDPLTRVSTLAEDYLVTGDHLYKQTVLERARSVTREEVIASWTKWMTQGAFEVRMIAEPSYVSSGPDPLNRSTPPVVEDTGEVPLPEAVELELSNGVGVTYYQVPSANEVNIRLSTPGGFASATGDRSGLPALTLHSMIGGGAAGRSPEVITGQIFDTQMEITSEVLPTLNQFVVKFPESDMFEALALFGDMLARPDFDADAVQLEVKKRQETLTNVWTNPAEASAYMVGQVLFGAESTDGLNAASQPSASLLENVSRDDLVAYWQNWISPKGSSIVAVGDVDPLDFVFALEAGLDAWQADSAEARGASATAPASVALTPGQLYVVDVPGADQSSIEVLLPRESLRGREYTPDAILADRLLDIVGGGFNSRVSENIRKTKGWTYGVGGNFEEILGQNVMQLETTVQTDRTADAIVEIIREFEDVVSERPITEEEFDRSFGALRGFPAQHYSDSQMLGVVLPWLVTDDYDADYFNRIASASRDLTHEDLNAYAQRSGLDPASFTWVVAGDRAEIQRDLEALSLGDINYLERP